MTVRQSVGGSVGEVRTPKKKPLVVVPKEEDDGTLATLQDFISLQTRRIDIGINPYLFFLRL